MSPCECWTPVSNRHIPCYVSHAPYAQRVPAGTSPLVFPVSVKGSPSTKSITLHPALALIPTVPSMRCLLPAFHDLIPSQISRASTHPLPLLSSAFSPSTGHPSRQGFSVSTGTFPARPVLDLALGRPRPGNDHQSSAPGAGPLPQTRPHSIHGPPPPGAQPCP